MVIRLLILVVFLAIAIYALIKVKNSRLVDKIADALFTPPKENTVDDAIAGIKTNKQTLKDKSVANSKAIKDIATEQEKINKNL
jgi:hypothetical protein